MKIDYNKLKIYIINSGEKEKIIIIVTANKPVLEIKWNPKNTLSRSQEKKKIGIKSNWDK